MPGLESDIVIRNGGSVPLLPPPPPPPPLQSSTPYLQSRRWSPADLSRVPDNQTNAPSGTSGCEMDLATIQHIAANLRKTINGESFRSVQSDISNERMAGTNRCVSERNRSDDSIFSRLEADEAGEQVYAPTSRANHSVPIGHFHRPSDQVMNERSLLEVVDSQHISPTRSQLSPYYTTSNAKNNARTASPHTVSTLKWSGGQRMGFVDDSVDYAKRQKPVWGNVAVSGFNSSPNINNLPSYCTTSETYRREGGKGGIGGDLVQKTIAGQSLYGVPEREAGVSFGSRQPMRTEQRAPSSSPYGPAKNISSSPLDSVSFKSAELDPYSKMHSHATSTPTDRAVRQYCPTSSLQHGRSLTTTVPSRIGIDSHDFSRELRDRGLTVSQKAANRFQNPISGQASDSPPLSLTNVYHNSSSMFMGNDAVNILTQRMQRNMLSGEGAAGEYNCAKCGDSISGQRPGCTALNQTYHLACFTCIECQKELAGGSFYSIEGRPYCEIDYMNTLEKCDKCGKAIMEKLLRASGKVFHPLCFVCFVCSTSLDGIPFTVDSANNVHCVACFHEKFAPRCAVCSQPIVPDKEGGGESVRVVAMDKSFHVNCYRCEDCDMKLSSKIEGHGCYPLDDHLYCKNCNVTRVRTLTAQC